MPPTNCGPERTPYEAWEIAGFGRDWDPQPIHPDPEAAETPPFGGLIASGSLLVALSVRLLVDHPHRAAAIPGLGWERVRFMEPVREGDTLTLTRECQEARPSRSDASRGVIRNRIALTNQHGMRVLES